MADELIWLRDDKSGVGRPPQRSRAEITAAAVRLADRDGLDAVSMRQVASSLGTAAGSLYRYLDTREDLLDLMADHVYGEYDLTSPDPDQWLTELLDLAEQARGIFRRHPWLVELVLTRPVVGPRGADVIEHVLTVLETHPADDATKLTAFAVLTSFVASTVQNERGGADNLRSARYLAHLATQGNHPRLAALNAAAATTDPFRHTLRRILEGLLQSGGPAAAAPEIPTGG